ncbi:hypothetical protein L7F22_040918 [Adiantum nelumboides]|nr:hypothetical protein [Adiantum nelumboides]
MALLSSCLSGEVACRLLFSPVGSKALARTACIVGGLVIPAYSSFRAIELKDTAEQEQWLLYWTDFELLRGNIKSTNVLLGPTFAPKIVDVGLSRLLNVSVARAKGVFGYAPPKNTKGEAFIKGSDVFNFEILLLELISGKNPLEKIQTETGKLSIIEWAQDLVVREKMTELVDSRLHDKYNQDELGKFYLGYEYFRHSIVQAKRAIRKVAQCALLYVRIPIRHTKPLGKIGFVHVYGCFSAGEVFSDRLLSWLPGYYHAKLAFLMWLQLPLRNGSRQLLSKYFRPPLLKYRCMLDGVVNCAQIDINNFLVAYLQELKFLKAIVRKLAQYVFAPEKGVKNLPKYVNDEIGPVTKHV